MVASWVRMKFWPMSNSSCSLMVSLCRPSWMIGTLEASYLMMLGGRVPGRHGAEQGLRNGGDLGEGEFDFGVRLEVDAGDGDAGVGLRLDVLDIVHRGGHGPLEERDHALFHLFGGEAVVVPDDADDGDIDIREDIDRHVMIAATPKMAISSDTTTKV